MGISQGGAATRFGLVAGAPSPKRMSGTMMMPHYAHMVNSGGITTTATRLYFAPIFLDQVDTWLGMRAYNNGAANTGDKLRLGIYTEASAGGPGSLLKDCGEVTLTAAAAVLTATNSFTNTYIGWHYVAIHAQSATPMRVMGAQEQRSDVAYRWGAIAAQAIASLDSAGAIIAGYSAGPQPFMSVDTVYGTLASTAVTPTICRAEMPALAVYK